MSQKKLQVFLSSTYIDMKAERQSAVEAILQSGHIPAGMELFASGDESQWETIRKWIDDSDVFMLILGARYGSLEPKFGKSYIHLEYEYAIEKKKPFFAAVISEKCIDAKLKSIGADAIERDNSHLLKQFRTAVTDKICRFFDDTKDVKIIVFESLGRFIQNENIVGWVRGSEVIDTKATLEEMNRLQAEKSSYFKELEQLRAYLSATSNAESSLIDSLSNEAKTLLTAAASKDGHFIYTHYLESAELGVSEGTNFIANAAPRDMARWKSAIKELEKERLVEALGSQRDMFQLTNRGWEVAEEITNKAKAEPQSPKSPE